MNYAEALDYIHSVNWVFCKPGLDRIRTLCASLGDPQNSLKFIHVAGTNGKGSLCAMTASVLRAAGLRVGLYTSPYIVRFNERMQVNGESISDGELCELVELIRPHADAMDDKPTEFELITAVAFLYFVRHACDIVVLECGLGGRLDATNLIKTPLLSVITGIATTPPFWATPSSRSPPKRRASSKRTYPFFGVARTQVPRRSFAKRQIRWEPPCSPWTARA